MTRALDCTCRGERTQSAAQFLVLRLERLGHKARWRFWVRRNARDHRPGAVEVPERLRGDESKCLGNFAAVCCYTSESS